VVRSVTLDTIHLSSDPIHHTEKWTVRIYRANSRYRSQP